MPDADETEVTDSPDETATDDNGDQEPTADDDQGDTIVYKRADIEKLRSEAKTNRHRAEAAEKRVDELSRALFTARVEASGKLETVEDLPFDAALLDDPDALDSAIDDLLTRRPHYAKRKVAGNVGAGLTGTREEPFSLLGRLQQSV